jgi:hypothetical protein
MSKAGINRNLDNAGFTGANNNPNNPGTTNPFATDAEIDILQQQINNISGGTGNFVISGNVSWSGSGLIYDVTTHVYVIQGTQYTSAATQVTLTADPTFDQYWVVYGDSTGAVGTIAGVPAPVPVPPSVDGLTQIVFATILVPAGATIPVITEVTVYDEDAGTPTEWAGTSDDTNVNFASTNDPYQGTVSVETNLPLGTNREIIFTPAAPYTIVSPSTLVFQIKAKQDMSAAAGRLYIGFFNGGSLVGNAIYIGGTTVPLYGFDATDTSGYQIVSISFAAFGVLPATVDALRFFKLSGTSDADFFLDDVHILEGGAVTPPTTILFLNDLGDVTTGLPITPTNADDGRVLYFDVDTNQWISDDIANISNVVKDCKTSVGTGSIPKGTPVYLAGYDNDLIVVEACDAANAAEMPCIGITAEALDSTNAKKVISFGKLQGVDTSAYSEGDVLYVAAGGGFTTTRPTGTSLIQRIAIVLKADNPGGILKVINTSRTAGLPNLPQDNVWVGDNNAYPQPEPLCPFILTDLLGTDKIAVCRWNGSSFDRFAISGQSILDLQEVSGSGTLNYLPKWTPDGSTLGDSVIQDDGDTVGVNGVPITNYQLAVYNDVDDRYAVAAVALANTTNSALFAVADGGTNNYGIEVNASNGDFNRGLYSSVNSVSNPGAIGLGVVSDVNSLLANPFPAHQVAGVSSKVQPGGGTGDIYGGLYWAGSSNANDNIGIWVKAENPGAGNSYPMQIIDGNEAVGKVLTSDALGRATWQTPGGGGGSGVNWIPMFSGGLFATNQTFYSNWEEATGIQGNVETPFPAGTLNAFKINCNTNNANNPTVIDVMRGASVLISVTIPGLTTGIFEATGSVAIANNDLLSIRVTIPAGGPSIGLRGGLLSITV